MSMHDPREREERSQPDVLPLHKAQMRELEDPRDGFAPTPVWLLFLCFGLVAGTNGPYTGRRPVAGLLRPYPCCPALCVRSAGCSPVLLVVRNGLIRR